MLILRTKWLLPKSPQESAEFPIVLRDLIRLNSIVLPSPNDKMCRDEVFVDRFRYQFIMFEMGILIGTYRLLHDHIAYKIVI